MTDWELKREIQATMAQRRPFEPQGEGAEPKLSVPAMLLHELILDHKGNGSLLWLRRVQIVGLLNLEALNFEVRLRFDECAFDDPIHLYQTCANDIQLLKCELNRGLLAKQLETNWNLDLGESILKGGLDLRGTKIGGELSLIGAILGGDAQGKPAPALNLDHAEVAGDMVCDGLIADGEIRLLQAKIGGQLSLNGARLKGGKDDDGLPSPAFDADGFEVAGDMFCEELICDGEMRLLQGKIGGQLALNDARITGNDDGGSPQLAFSADASEIAGGMFCRKLVSVGEMRLPAAQIGSVLVLREATLECGVSKDDSRRPALNGVRAMVAGSILCEGLSATGEIWLGGVDVAGQLSMAGALLLDDSDGTAFSLHGSKVDELVLAFGRIEGGVDLRGACVRSLWDANGQGFLGHLPPKFRLEGFRYESFREPLGAEKRLEWIARSQSDNHYPDVYGQLAEAFRRIGRRGDARKVAIANERRARKDCTNIFRRAWHDIQWLTVGYGYRNWLALIWLSVVILVGSGLFMTFEWAFEPNRKQAPPLEPVLYAIDATVPILELSQSRAWTTTSGMAWVELGLAVAGYALIAAVIAAAAGLFNRDQV